jgi:superfamily II DNA/RNA helicase
VLAAHMLARLLAARALAHTSSPHTQGDVTKRRKVLVFCSSMDSCRAVEHSCQDRDLPTVCYHGDMPIDARRESMAAFAGAAAATAAGAAGGAEGGGSSSGSARPASIMVATDLAARGLDFPGTIDHVINFDMPSNGIDYLHRWAWLEGGWLRAACTASVSMGGSGRSAARVQAAPNLSLNLAVLAPCPCSSWRPRACPLRAGRTARAGASGRVTSLLQDRRDKRMAQAIQHAMSHKIPLDQVISGSNGKQTVPAVSAGAGAGGCAPV